MTDHDRLPRYDVEVTGFDGAGRPVIDLHRQGQRPDAVLAGPAWVLWDGDGNELASGDELVIPLSRQRVSETEFAYVPISAAHLGLPGGLRIQWSSAGIARFHLDGDCEPDGG